ncbi:putative 2-amino-4-hydroxy-6-hydroxymethyldihydropteridine diphosphokinase [Bacteroidales bacterium KA00251]|nr:putative 2-amino-4-hydroxy-6-hydroxymethyldihydropteridine diphosphokinase [Bacteroidales bacterium KA00251]
MDNKAIISIGSNTNRTENIQKVIEILQANYPRSRFSTPEITDPIDLPEGAKAFLNLVAMVPTNLDKEEFVSQLKSIEEDLGRDDDDEEEGIIPIDLDLIKWNEDVLKPRDFIRPYMVSGLEEIDEF